jgi:hypothetical protein
LEPLVIEEGQLVKTILNIVPWRIEPVSLTRIMALAGRHHHHDCSFPWHGERRSRIAFSREGIRCRL